MTEMEQRIFVDAYEEAIKNPKYTKHTEKIIILGRKIMKCLGPHASLFLEYEIASNLAKGIRIENAYKLGFKNGISQSEIVT